MPLRVEKEKNPISFYIQKLKDAEKQYTTHEKEMMVVVRCLQALGHYSEVNVRGSDRQYGDHLL